MTHDYDRHLDYLRQCLRQDKAPLAFFLSAGCGMAVTRSDGTTPLVPDIRGLTDQTIARLADSKHAKAFGALCASFPEGATPTIEDFLGRIRALLVVTDTGSVHGLDANALNQLDAEICNFIADAIRVELPAGPSPHHSLAVWAAATSRTHPVELFTTNYDLLFEQALERVSLPYFDGFVGSRRPFFDPTAVDQQNLPTRWLRLWKLHGSSNWRRDAQGVVVRTIETDHSSPALIHPSHLKYDESRRMPYVAMVDRLRAFLRNRRAILILSGYSFGDEHLESILMQELEANPTAAAFALMFTPLKDCGRACALATVRPNLSVLARDGAVIGTTQGDWAPRSDGSQSIGDIGDFSTLGKLLADISGEPRDSLDRAA